MIARYELDVKRINSSSLTLRTESAMAGDYQSHNVTRHCVCLPISGCQRHLRMSWGAQCQQERTHGACHATPIRGHHHWYMRPPLLLSKSVGYNCTLCHDGLLPYIILHTSRLPKKKISTDGKEARKVSRTSWLMGSDVGWAGTQSAEFEHKAPIVEYTKCRKVFFVR